MRSSSDGSNNDHIDNKNGDDAKAKGNNRSRPAIATLRKPNPWARRRPKKVPPPSPATSCLSTSINQKEPIKQELSWRLRHNVRPSESDDWIQDKKIDPAGRHLRFWPERAANHRQVTCQEEHERTCVTPQMDSSNSPVDSNHGHLLSSESPTPGMERATMTSSATSDLSPTVNSMPEQRDSGPQPGAYFIPGTQYESSLSDQEDQAEEGCVLDTNDPQQQLETIPTFDAEIAPESPNPIPMIDDDRVVLMVLGKRRLMQLLSLAALLVGVVLVVPVVFGSGGNSNGETTLDPNQTLELTLSPPTNYTPPTPVPDSQCFITTDELLDAIDQYLSDSGSNTTVANKYGWPIARWCVSDISDFSLAFSSERNSAAATFDESLAEWDTSWAHRMYGMFSGAAAFNQNLSHWDVSRVANLEYMFQSASSFNQDISSWDVSKVIELTGIFLGASSFNQNISQWDVSAVTSLQSAFSAASVFNQDLSSWDVRKVTDFSSAFLGANSFNQQLSSWDVSAATDFEDMFREASAFNQDISSWNISSASTLRSMFQSAISFNQNLSTWDVSNVVFMRSMFKQASSFDGEVSGWETTKVKDFAFMFQGATSFNRDLSLWNVSNVTDFTGMFSGALAFNQDLCKWGEAINAGAVMEGMFEDTACLTEEEIDHLGNPPEPFCYPCS